MKYQKRKKKSLLKLNKKNPPRRIFFNAHQSTIVLLVSAFYRVHL